MSTNASLTGSLRLPNRPTRPFCSSWLEKQPEWRPSWDLRYVVLDGNRLEYRITEGAVPKKSGTLVALEKQATADSFAFRVWLLEGGSWTLKASNKALYDRWMSALELALVPSSANPVSPGPRDGTTRNHDNKSITAEDLAAAAAAASASASAEGTSPTPAAEIDSPTLRSDASTRNWSIPPQPADTASTHSSSRHPRYTDPNSEVANQVLLTAAVEKQAAWTMKWNPRVIELREGCQLVYRVVNGDARRRYFVVGIDRSAERHHETHLLFTTSCEESFWVNFHTQEECEQWYVTVRAEMKKCNPWHWSSMRSVGPSDNLSGKNAGFTSMFSRLMERRAATTAPLHVQYHCSALLAPSSGLPRIVVFGGCTSYTMASAVSSQQRWFAPHCSLQQLTNACVSLSLRGFLKAAVMEVEPYAEQVSVKVRAPMLYGATMSLMSLDVSSSVRSNINEKVSASSKSQLFAMIIGGLSGMPQCLPETEIWGLGFPIASSSAGGGGGVVHGASGNGGGPYWLKWLVPSSQLPPLAFHSAVVLSSPPLSAVRAVHSAQLSRQWVLLTGGVDHELSPMADTYLLSWHTADVPGMVKEKVVVERAVPLPEPRAFHGSAVLKNGTIVVVGGRSTRPAASMSTVLVMRPPSIGDMQSPTWEPVQWADETHPLPPLPDVAVAVTPSGQSLVLLAQVSVAKQDAQGGVRLYLLHLESGGLDRAVTASWEEIPVRMGMVPKRVQGCTIHVHDGYVYVLGGAQLSEGVAPTLCGPLRVLMG